MARQKHESPRAVPVAASHAAALFGAQQATANETVGAADTTTQLPLVLDLDGTLIRTDVLAETFIAYLRRNPLRLFQVIVWFFMGRAVLKQKLAHAAEIDVAGLPVTEDLVSFAAREAAHDREVHLATAADMSVAERVRERFPFISRVFASNGDINLKSREKARVLTEAFPDGFAYAGNSRADLAVWQTADETIIVNPAPGLVKAARAIRAPSQIIAWPRRGLRFAAKVLRLHQWAKNGLIFAPLLLGGVLFEAAAWGQAAAGFLALSVLASATYLLNDLFDLADDRRHWSKRTRPLASGALPIAHALVLIPTGMAVAYAIAALAIGTVGVAFLTAYLAVTLAYSFSLKKIELLDAAVLASLFTLRLGFGVALAGVVLSPWLLVFSMFLFLSLSFAKRHVEVTRMEARGRSTAAGRGYKAGDGPMVAMIGAASGLAAVQVLVMYVMNEAYRAGAYVAPVMLWAVPPILFLWIARIWLLAQRGELDDDPVAFAVKDPPSLLLGFMLGFVFLVALFGSPVCTRISSMSETHRILRFLVVGTLAAAVNWVARIILSWLFAPALSFELAVVIAYAIGMTSGFLLYRAHVFPESDLAVAVQIRRFIAVNLASAAEVWVIAVLLVGPLAQVTGHEPLAEALAHGVAIACGAATSYLGHRLLTFRQVQQAS